MQFLQLVSRVSEDFTVVLLNDLLGYRQSGVQHVLIVLDDGSVSSELVIEAILSVAQDVALVRGRSHV